MIHLEANNPPGKRCALYLRYAEKAGQLGQFPVSVTFRPALAEQERITPTLSINGKAIIPSNGEILSPQDIFAALPDAVPELLAALIEIQGVPFQLRVISQQPPGGRCTLYARYAQEISSRFGMEMDIVHTASRDAHGTGFPSLLLNGMALQPSDGVILSPADIHAELTRLAPHLTGEQNILQRLEDIQNNFLEGM